MRAVYRVTPTGGAKRRREEQYDSVSKRSSPSFSCKESRAMSAKFESSDLSLSPRREDDDLDDEPLDDEVDEDDGDDDDLDDDVDFDDDDEDEDDDDDDFDDDDDLDEDDEDDEDEDEDE